MADTTTTTNVANTGEGKSFMGGIMDTFSSFATSAGALADAYAKIKPAKASDTPGATGAGTPAAQPASPGTLNGTMKTVLVGIGAALLLILGIKLFKR